MPQLSSPAFPDKREDTSAIDVSKCRYYNKKVYSQSVSTHGRNVYGRAAVHFR